MDCRIRDCRVVHRDGSILSLPPDFLVEPLKKTGAFAQSKKCYIKIQWHMCITKMMWLLPLLTLIYFNWKYQCSNNKFQMGLLIEKRKESLIFVWSQHALCQIQLMMRMLMVILMLTSKNKHWAQTLVRFFVWNICDLGLGPSQSEPKLFTSDVKYQDYNNTDMKTDWHGRFKVHDLMKYVHFSLFNKAIVRH